MGSLTLNGMLVGGLLVRRAGLSLTGRDGFSFSGRAIGTSTPKLTDFSQAVKDFKTNGVAILPLRMDESFVAKSREMCMKAWQDALYRARTIRGVELGLGMEHGFQECVLRAPGRYDLHWGVNGVPHFLDQQQVLDMFLPFVHEVFGGENMTRMNFNGCLMSLPGAREQAWHVDGEHLFSSEPNVQCYGNTQVTFFDKNDQSSILPAHCLNVFVPLVDVEGANGGTEFCLGSHFHSKFFSEDIVWQDSSWKDRIGFKGEVLQIKINSGEVLAFDYRVLHRALHHGGDQPRPLLYYTFTKRWFSDAMNFASLPSLREADSLVAPVRGVTNCRQQFPSLQHKGRILCDGAGGSQVPTCVTDRMAAHLNTVGGTNIGGEYGMSTRVLDTITGARQAARRLLGVPTTGQVAFGQNCTNLMFHLARAVENSHILEKGDNILLSRACHEANIAPWLLMAEKTGVEVRWMETVPTSEDANMDELSSDLLPQLIDSRTKMISLGLASNATGRIHSKTLDRIKELQSNMTCSPLLVLDLTHYVPHRRTNLADLGADAIICSAYKFFGPHLGVMAYNIERLSKLRPSKVGLRFSKEGITDLLNYGEIPDRENFEISMWEMGTLNYEALAGFEACVDYLSSLSPVQTGDTLDTGFTEIQQHEEKISERFLNRLQPLLDARKLRLYGSRDPKQRTPTFALSLTDGKDPLALVKSLTEHGVHCTHGNHYAVNLVEDSLGAKDGVTRLSFLHYNTVQEVDAVADIIHNTCIYY